MGIWNMTMPNTIRFQAVCDKIVAIFQDLKWSGFRILDPIWNPDHLETNLFSKIQNPDESEFQIPTACEIHASVTKGITIVLWNTLSNNFLFIL